VIVTHDLGEAARFGGTIVLMRDGAIVQQGALADLVYHPADPFVTRFVTAQRSPLEALKAGPPGTGRAGAGEEPP
jgi:osmoprotectant transport system ATP-binding protein